MKAVLASTNPNKIVEINAILGEGVLDLVLPPEGFDPIEDGTTFLENALIKAKAAYELTGLPAIADDSGLCVDYLGGRPGIYSARYADTPQLRISKLLSEMENVPDEKRNAKFVCAIVMLDASGNVVFSEVGECFGKIGYEVKGQNGFGYDPIFEVAGKNASMAELPEEEKNIISHRGLAVAKLKAFLLKYNSQEA